MKHLLRFSAVILLVLGSCVPPQQEQPEETTVDSYQEFYDGLSPYGHWVHHPQYGYIWMPEAGPDFVPYSTNGYWVWTNHYGWTWVSDYEWGWAPFHYGRWNYEPFYGWYWVPDLMWGPAWVAWRECPGYYGWAPMGPGIGIDIVLGGGYLPPDYWWTVCDNHYMGDRDIGRHFEPHERRGRILGGESRGIGNSSRSGGKQRENFVTGPSRDQVQTATGRPVTEVKIQPSNRRGESLNGNTLNVYRPENLRSPGSQAKPVPRSVTTPQDIHDLHDQAQPPATRSRGGSPPQGTPQTPRQSSPPPRQQQTPRREATPRQPAPQRAPQATPRSNGSQEKRPK
ncbi:MAG: hypothetical protein Q8916_13515 [Bacteroidota bacterium]|nr:hypothetical protein [Bacteroidota bacterium]MDP4231412.1 hypothetical protein [Bacteroidota bacterium]MDP4237152.1 hypothetical protein [Bacteroidota bacterium]